MASFAVPSMPIGPTNALVSPLLTDMYQISMTYAYWKNNRHNDQAVFDLFFRKNPFKGEYTVFAGQDEVLKFLSAFKFTESDLTYLQSILPLAEPAFFAWLQDLDCREVKIYSFQDGSVVFPREPLLRVEGPLAICQLLETTLLNLVNYPSLVATNAARMRMAAGSDKELLEFGLRRAQGPDGGLSASKYAYLGGFNASSNVLAGKLYGIGVKGTHAHSFVMAHSSMADLATTVIRINNTGEEVEFVSVVLAIRDKLDPTHSTNNGELAAFIAYAQAFPSGFLALIDTYDTLNSGLINFAIVAVALLKVSIFKSSSSAEGEGVGEGGLAFKIKPVGIRLDSGDLAYLSKKVRAYFRDIDRLLPSLLVLDTNTDDTPIIMSFSFASQCRIVASNDIDEDIILALNREGHEIDVFGIGTHLVTCQKQPALGCVYKLVEVNGIPRIKLSQEASKMVIPGKKEVYRLYGKDGHPLVDIMTLSSHPPTTANHNSNDGSSSGTSRSNSNSGPIIPPSAGSRILARHPFVDSKRAFVVPARVENMLRLVFDGSNGGIQVLTAEKATAEKAAAVAGSSVIPSLSLAKAHCRIQLAEMREDHIRPLNPTPYKISVSDELHGFIKELWLSELPVKELV